MFDRSCDTHLINTYKIYVQVCVIKTMTNRSGIYQGYHCHLDLFYR